MEETRQINSYLPLRKSVVILPNHRERADQNELINNQRNVPPPRLLPDPSHPALINYKVDYPGSRIQIAEARPSHKQSNRQTESSDLEGGETPSILFGENNFSAPVRRFQTSGKTKNNFLEYNHLSSGKMENSNPIIYQNPTEIQSNSNRESTKSNTKSRTNRVTLAPHITTSWSMNLHPMSTTAISMSNRNDFIAVDHYPQENYINERIGLANPNWSHNSHRHLFRNSNKKLIPSPVNGMHQQFPIRSSAGISDWMEPPGVSLSGESYASNFNEDDHINQHTNRKQESKSRHQQQLTKQDNHQQRRPSFSDQQDQLIPQFNDRNIHGTYDTLDSKGSSHQDQFDTNLDYSTNTHYGSIVQDGIEKNNKDNRPNSSSKESEDFNHSNFSNTTRGTHEHILNHTDRLKLGYNNAAVYDDELSDMKTLRQSQRTRNNINSSKNFPIYDNNGENIHDLHLQSSRKTSVSSSQQGKELSNNDPPRRGIVEDVPQFRHQESNEDDFNFSTGQMVEVHTKFRRPNIYRTRDKGNKRPPVGFRPKLVSNLGDVADKVEPQSTIYQSEPVPDAPVRVTTADHWYLMPVQGWFALSIILAAILLVILVVFYILYRSWKRQKTKIANFISPNEIFLGGCIDPIHHELCTCRGFSSFVRASQLHERASVISRLSKHRISSTSKRAATIGFERSNRLVEDLRCMPTWKGGRRYKDEDSESITTEQTQMCGTPPPPPLAPKMSIGKINDDKKNLREMEENRNNLNRTSLSKEQDKSKSFVTHFDRNDNFRKSCASNRIDTYQEIGNVSERMDANISETRRTVSSSPKLDFTSERLLHKPLNKMILSDDGNVKLTTIYPPPMRFDLQHEK